eukprot:2439468-Rhodomonas_salina.2
MDWEAPVHGLRSSSPWNPKETRGTPGTLGMPSSGGRGRVGVELEVGPRRSILKWWKKRKRVIPCSTRQMSTS